MDTSDQYIKMCDCEEIQEGKEQEGVGGHWHSGCIILEHGGDYFKVVDEEAVRKCGECGHSEDYILSTKSTWLPRQDQLQEMLSDDIGDLYEILWKNTAIVSSFRRTRFWDKCTTMEQLWLCLVMCEKYHKEWNGETWT